MRRALLAIAPGVFLFAVGIVLIAAGDALRMQRCCQDDTCKEGT